MVKNKEDTSIDRFKHFGKNDTHMYELAGILKTGTYDPILLTYDSNKLCVRSKPTCLPLAKRQLAFDVWTLITFRNESDL